MIALCLELLDTFEEEVSADKGGIKLLNLSDTRDASLDLVGAVADFTTASWGLILTVRTAVGRI